MIARTYGDICDAICHQMEARYFVVDHNILSISLIRTALTKIVLLHSRSPLVSFERAGRGLASLPLATADRRLACETFQTYNSQCSDYRYRQVQSRDASHFASYHERDDDSQGLQFQAVTHDTG